MQLPHRRRNTSGYTPDSFQTRSGQQVDNPPLASSDTAKFKIILAEGTRENWSKIDKAFAEIDKLLERNGERWDEYFREKVAERIRNMESSINVLQWGMGVLGAGAATIIGLLIYLLTHGHSA